MKVKRKKIHNGITIKKNIHSDQKKGKVSIAKIIISGLSAVKSVRQFLSQHLNSSLCFIEWQMEKDGKKDSLAKGSSIGFPSSVFVC